MILVSLILPNTAEMHYLWALSTNSSKMAKLLQVCYMNLRPLNISTTVLQSTNCSNETHILHSTEQNVFFKFGA